MSDTTLSGLQEDAVYSFKEYIFGLGYPELLDFCQQDEPHDIISEMADSGVPVYTAEILETAANNTELATEESDLGGTTPLEIITQNIYCALEAEQWEWWNDNKDELEEECQNVVDALESFQDAIKHPDVDDQYEDEEDVFKLMGTVAKDYCAGSHSLVDDDDTVEEVIFKELDAWYKKHTAKEKV
jgi:hypothetical protein